jgi:hypothetical protein
MLTVGSHIPPRNFCANYGGVFSGADPPNLMPISGDQIPTCGPRTGCIGAMAARVGIGAGIGGLSDLVM